MQKILLKDKKGAFYNKSYFVLVYREYRVFIMLFWNCEGECGKFKENISIVPLEISNRITLL